MNTPTIAVEIHLHEPDRTVHGEYRVAPSETLAELFDRFAREYPAIGSRMGWVILLQGSELSWLNTVAQVARMAGHPAVLVLGLSRIGTDRKEGEGAGGDWGVLPPLSSVPKPPVYRGGGGAGGFSGPAPGAPAAPAPAPAVLPQAASERYRAPADSAVFRDEMPRKSKRMRAEFDADDDLADEAEELRKSVSRQATVRYYHRMNPQRVYPFLVVLSAEEIAEIAQKTVRQATGERFDVRAESPVEIEPVLPGCQCYPPRHTLVIGPETQSLEFWVVPQVLGTIKGAKVIVRQDGNTLSEVKLEAKVVKQTAAVVVGLMSFVMPYVSKGLKSDDPDGTKLQSALNWVATSLRPEMIWAGLALVAVGLYFWCRPRKRDQFWDVMPKK